MIEISKFVYLNSWIRIKLCFHSRYVWASFDYDIDHIKHRYFKVVERGLILDLNIRQYESHYEAFIQFISNVNSRFRFNLKRKRKTHTRMLIFANWSGRRHVQTYIIIEGIQTQRLQISCHQAAYTVEKRLLLLKLSTVGYKLSFVALVEYVLHLNEPFLSQLVLGKVNILHARIQKHGQIDRILLRLYFCYTIILFIKMVI